MKPGNGELTQSARSGDRGERATGGRRGRPRVQLGTSATEEWIRFPQELAAGLDDERESLELWHNHLDTPSAPADALPGIDDIVMAMRAGVVRVGVVDDEANARIIRAGAKPVDPPEAARPWLLAAAALADIAMGTKLGPHSDPVQVRLDALEMTLAAAHVVGLVEFEELDPPARGDAPAHTADGAAEHTAAEPVKPVPERPGRAWKKDGRYTEADIARLEAGDLTDSDVCAKLVVAYHRNDTATDAFPGFRRDLNVFVPEAALRAKLAALEAVASPDARTRTLRMRILSALAMRAKRGIPPRWGWTYEAEDA